MNLPLELTQKRILLAGAGGGFDVLAGLPVGLQLEKQGNQVFYANYSFTHLAAVNGAETICEGCLKVSGQAQLTDGDYFPEKHLAQWLAEQNHPHPEVFCFGHLGVDNLRTAYTELVHRLNLDAILVFDGGCDGLFRGDEYDLGTPSMDSISIIAASLLPIGEKYYVLTAFGSEGANHEVSHAEALERMSDLARNGGFLGTCSLVNQDTVFHQFQNCMSWVYSQLPKRTQSNIVNSILQAAKGFFGYHAVTEKIQSAPIWLSPLTSLYWFFQAEEVAKQKLFYKDVLTTATVQQVAEEIEKHRRHKAKARPNIPI